MRFKIYLQNDAMDCGPACLRMIAKAYGKTYSLQYLREQCFITREGVSMLGISEAAELMGFKTLGSKITVKQLRDNISLPCILHWNQNHFVVCYDIKHSRSKCKFYIADPAFGKQILTETDLRKHWISSKIDGEEVGLALSVEPGVDFNGIECEKETKADISYFVRYISPYKRQIVQLLIGTLVVMGLNYVAPFLTQATFDIGIRNKDLNFITLILIIQLVISSSKILIGFVQHWISLHVNVRINIELISDYLMKLSRMPLHFFDTKMMGDFLQRIDDHRRIRSFLMGRSVNMIFSISTFIVFAVILACSNRLILATFIVGNCLYVAWVLMFMRFRKELDHNRFAESAKLQNCMVQFIQGMQDIKLNNIETRKRWEWERIQASLYKINIKSLKVGQIQSAGSIFFSSTTNILISYFSAKMLVDGSLSLGEMMALSFIIGQLSGPIGTFIGFAQAYQDARISMERLSEINKQEDEDLNIETKFTSLPDCKDIVLEHVSFSYSGADRDYVLKDVCIRIPENKVTAIVGASGSGKTTLLKLIQGFYKPNKGHIYIDKVPLCQINPHFWRSRTGAVMQDSFIFSDTIADNIAVCTDEIDRKRLLDASRLANIHDFINTLPLNYNTKIGPDGIGLSQGQRQRVLIARAIYKSPEYIFMDEATNSLDANNELEIMKNLRTFYKGKTVVVAAHRLSTVKDADMIVVLDNGGIVEKGTHSDLLELGGYYCRLVRNQMS